MIVSGQGDAKLGRTDVGLRAGSGKLGDKWPEKHKAAHQARNRIARKSDDMDDLAVYLDVSVHQRLAWPHGDLPEIELDSKLLQRAMHEVPVSDGSTANCNQNVDIALQAVFYRLLDFRGIIGNDPLVLRSPAGSPHDLGNSHAVRRNDLILSGYLARKH